MFGLYAICAPLAMTTVRARMTWRVHAQLVAGGARVQCRHRVGDQHFGAKFCAAGDARAAASSFPNAMEKAR